MRDSELLLEAENLKVHFDTPEGTVPAVDGVSFSIPRRTTLALVGESGCGKTVTALSILRLLKSPPARISADRLLFNGTDIRNLTGDGLKRLRGGDIAMVFQEPMTSLNPVFRISKQMREVYEYHTSLAKGDIDTTCIDALRQVGVPDPAQKYYAYPHELSGGLRQRVMIAMALSARPKLLIADEPTTALDVTIQAQILHLLGEITASSGMSILLITHDFGVVADLADEVIVMYAGKVVEAGNLDTVLYSPMHPYTSALINSIPGVMVKRGERLNSIAGMIPNPLRLPPGCRFAPRCPVSDDRCRQEEPPLEDCDGRRIACFHWRRG